MIFFFSFGPNGPNWGLSTLLFLVPLLLQTGLASFLLRHLFNLSFWWRVITFILMGPMKQEQYSLFSLNGLLGLGATIALAICLGLSLARHVAWDRLTDFFANINDRLQSQFVVNNGRGRARVPPRSERVARVQRILTKLPIEEYKNKKDLMQMSVHELKEYMNKLGIQSRGLLEKEELVNQVIEKGGSTWQTCSICFDDYQSGDAIRRLPCMHTYHIECIDRWLLSSTDLSRLPACPFCNTNICKEE
eukprot:TRINITY_DN4548_c0_g1_i1.p2 TRINITY_DN4548_c0_g1~~TRINITY_DN4548_c0_g1_i1.p2  ORF type:complete len:248 (-),score=16.87 TRINITY_DN4548_c0_g1_i1:936-1679(-)